MALPQESRMHMAIHTYKCQKLCSQSKAPRVFSIPRSTLQSWLKGINPRSEIRANNHKLTVFEEETLVKRLLDADKRGFSIRPEYARRMVQILLHEHIQDPTACLGVNWAYSFIKRHPELCTRYNQRITY
jgi:hypothetical protein